MNRNEIGMSEWASLVEAHSGKSADEIPNGFVPRSVIQDELGLRESRARAVIRELVESGAAEMRMFRVRTACGMKSIPHYRITAETKTPSSRAGRPRT